MANPTGAPAQPIADAPSATASGIGLVLFRLVALGFGLLGLWVMWYAIDLVYYTPVGPGPGFFPMWLGGALALLSFAILALSLSGLSPALPADIIPARTPAMQMGVTFGSIAFFALAVERAGFVVTMFLVLLVLMLVNRVRLFPTALVVALVGSVGVGYAFVQWLGVFLPATPFGLLSAIGL
ncbi:tripartite tricarboxylate transporter TctB family protein [Starkeya sp. ORNL1]|uniref:tripartite tricarboxylate transporter TctB family protein n=1 Tax=Starkeya sp. ORNL1 TaxID=2709380 RepID=UPI001464181E|nr:tripartite tricarboxylate transporter TctB family protein [Starkeya sp. ORNL1]QJP17268.1 tripartite tricarboxylate transporter TctB family protein [Starkeya sp. ORNL1]